MPAGVDGAAAVAGWAVLAGGLLAAALCAALWALTRPQYAQPSAGGWGRYAAWTGAGAAAALALALVMPPGVLDLAPVGLALVVAMLALTVTEVYALRRWQISRRDG